MAEETENMGGTEDIAEAEGQKLKLAACGFVLKVICCILMVFYVIWAYFPGLLLNWNLTFWPQKYWAVAIPAYIVAAILMVEFIFYPYLNVLKTPGLDDKRIFHDKYSIYDKGSGIAPIRDLKISDASKMYHNSHSTKKQQ